MLPPTSDLHAEARRLASNGVPVFPCWPNSKVPYTDHGFHEATTDLVQVDAWWSAEPRLNIAFCPHMVGLAVIDLDGEEGEASWDGWQIEHGYLPLTYTVRTPRGGRHLYYRGVLPPTQSKLGIHVDTRGVGSYALVPPSRVDDKPYTLEDSRTAAELGDTVGEYLRQLQKERVRAAVSELDLPQNVARAAKLLQDYVDRGHVAIEGQMGDGKTFATACEVMNLGVSAPKCHELLCSIWNPACIPPWDEDELETKVENASRYSQNEAGAWAVESSADVFGSALDKLAPSDLEPSTATPKKRRFKRFSLAEMFALPAPTWLLKDLLPAQGVSLLFGQPGTFKSYIAVDWCCQLAALGIPVLYCAGEGSIGLAQRIKAWCLVHEIDPLTLPLELIRTAPWASDGDMLREFLEDEVKPFGPELIVMDTLARSAVGLDENSAKDMGTIVSMCDLIRNESKAAVLLIHHSGKDDAKGARGSGALLGGVDAAFHAQRPSLTVKAVSIKCVRQKDAEERQEPWVYQGANIGDQMVLQAVSVAEFHALTSTLPKVKPQEIGAALRELGAIGEENGVETRVLATALATANSDTPEEADAAVTGYSTVLGRGAGGSFQAYCQGEPPKVSWFLPAA